MDWIDEIKGLVAVYGAEEVEKASKDILFDKYIENTTETLEQDEILKKMLQDNVDEFEI